MIQWIQNKKIKYEIIQCRYYNDCIKFMVEVVKQKIVIRSSKVLYINVGGYQPLISLCNKALNATSK